MKNYITFYNNKNKSTIFVSFNVFKKIMEDVLREVQGISIKTKKEEKEKPTIIISSKNNKINIKLNLKIEENVSKELIKDEIIKKSYSAFLNLCEITPQNIFFNIYF